MYGRLHQADREIFPKTNNSPCGTNNLPSSEDPETTAKNIINLTKNSKADTVKVAISGIIPRRGTFNLNYKLENQENITKGHLNVNSLRNKFISIEELIKSKLDIFLVSKTKINHSFLNHQFSIDGYKTYRRDRNNVGGFYVNENMTCRELTAQKIDSNFEIIFLEITLRTRK